MIEIHGQRYTRSHTTIDDALIPNTGLFFTRIKPSEYREPPHNPFFCFRRFPGRLIPSAPQCGGRVEGTLARRGRCKHTNTFVNPLFVQHLSFQSSTNPILPRVSRALKSRFVDKPVQFVVFDNGVAGLMGEHSVMDGTPTARMCDDILTWLADPTFELEPSAPYPAIRVSEPKPLDFDLSTTPALQDSIASAEKRLHTLASEQALSFVRTKYGKRAIKAFGVGPDGWAQLVIQLGYARLAAREAPNGRMTEWPVGAYEAAATRRFYKGRTETIRVVTNEAVDWVRAMDNPSIHREEKVAKFRNAVARHAEVAREAVMAEGVDRHMLGT